MAAVVRHQRQIVSDRDGGDEGVEIADLLPLSGERAEDAPGENGFAFGDREDLEVVREILETV